MIRTDLGIATAYAEAVSKGYTGTRDEFGQMFVDFGKTAEKVTEDKKAVEQMKLSVEETKNSVDTTASEFGQNIADMTAEAKAAITEHANTEKASATAAISEAKDAATGAITEAQTSATDAIASVKDSATAEITKKGTDTLATIPEDYTALSGQVSSLKKDLVNDYSTGQVILREKDLLISKLDILSDVSSKKTNSGIDVNMNNKKGVVFVKKYNDDTTIHIDKNTGLHVLFEVLSTDAFYADNKLRLQIYFYNSDYSKYIEISDAHITRLGLYDIDVIDYAKNKNINIGEMNRFLMYSVMATTNCNVQIKIYGAFTDEQVRNGINLAQKINNLREKDNKLETDVSKLKTDVSQLEPDVSQLELEPDAYYSKKMIPEYFFSTVEPVDFDTDEYLEEKIKSVPEGDSFIFITDPHWEKNEKNSTPIMKYIKSRLGIKSIIMGGDILMQHTSKYDASITMKKYFNEMISAFGKNFYPVHGNHDINTANASNYTTEELENAMLPYSVVENIFLSDIKSDVNFEDVSEKINNLPSDVTDEQKEEIRAYMNLHYYFDDKSINTRFIILSTGNNINGVINDVFGISNTSELYLQIDWLAEILKTTPKGFNVVICGHVMVNWRTNLPENTMQKVANIATARKLKSSVSVANTNHSLLLSERWYRKGVHNYDFSACEDIDKIIIIGGDTHWDVQAVSGYRDNVYTSITITDNYNPVSGDVPTIISQTDSCNSGNYELRHPMEKGTITEQCFDIVTICPDNKIVFTRIGAGNDRVILVN